MRTLLLAEELLLLGLDRSTGRIGDRFDGRVLPVALVRDLVDAGALHLDGGSGGNGTDGGDTVTPTGGEPEHPALAAALAAVTRGGTDTGSHAVAATAVHLARTPAGGAGGAVEQLVADGVLAAQEYRRFGLFRRVLLTEQDPEPDRALRTRLASLLVTETAPGGHDGLLLALLGLTDLAGDVLPPEIDAGTRGVAQHRAALVAQGAERDPFVRAYFAVRSGWAGS
ncbi:GPP34 family phosphoprotein [Pseudonocardia sp. ICBG1293]|uniref:GPP34 family phosphoprotein n=1 Tax=Pseudonocardia sp. ICBG1293 TaxID=2844382 RepID=UPI001CD008E6|nr:GPP34 family phosphoprotein [Pseudonocardia sp. ICBG1293]